ncbi:MAG: BCD family MFS transporter, partial [Gammaproteobacteria bacterium]|nr:BCD family MFS transporter [Gammaproteobacteria bacterium]
ASEELPLPRLLRLSLFQVSVGLALVLLNGTLNRVMIVELGVPSWLVALMVSLPLLFAPLRALIGHRSDQHRSFLGWRRVPYLWIGSLLQFGGLAIMPFALLVLSGDTHGPVWYGHVGAALAFLLCGAGLHTTQTAGLALATDLAPAHTRPRVVALLYVMLLSGMLVSSLLLGKLLAEFSPLRLIQVVQGAALATILMNLVALWKQEPRSPAMTRHDRPSAIFRDCWREFTAKHGARRLLLALGLGTAGFSMQDILLEPYGGQVLNLSVRQTTLLTALLAAGSLAAFGFAAYRLGRGGNKFRLAGTGIVIGIWAFAAVLLAAPFGSPLLFYVGTALIGFGGGLFSVSMLLGAMVMGRGHANGLALGAWGAVNATAAGVAITAGGVLRDSVSALAMSGVLGPALTGPAVGYGFVYQLEIVLLFASLVAVGPLVRPDHAGASAAGERMALAEFPS